jgi:excisionase family DNA binding protein
MKTYLTVKQVAERYQKHPDTIRKIAVARKLPAMQFGKRGAWLFDKQLLEEHELKNTTGILKERKPTIRRESW